MCEFFRKNWKKYIFYIFRWQCSTPILAWCVVVFAKFGATWATVIANFVGSCLFFHIDRWIFMNKDKEEWHTKRNVVCADCDKYTVRGYRLVKAKGYDKTESKPEWRCEDCSIRKYKGVFAHED